MAVVDLITGKIVGCKKNSAVWFHEKGHIVYNKSEKGIKNSFFEGIFWKLTIVTLVLNTIINSLFLKVYIFVTAFFAIYFYSYEEVWCWIYSLKNKKKWKKS